MSEYIETVIVGGGQAGLSISYYLTQQACQHIVLEQSPQASNAWRNQRWDSFTLVTPNWQIRLPGAEYQGHEPDGFMTRNEIVTYLERYVERFNLPVRYGIQVTAVEQNFTKVGYIVKTSSGIFSTTNVVVATGLFQRPKIPSFSITLPAQIKQLHSSEYRNPEGLPVGAVLVVGSGQSGCQIAEELYQTGIKVYLCVSSAGRIPRRYRGKDITWWIDKMGSYEQTVDKLPSPKAKFKGNPHLSGKGGGHTLNLHQFARDGVVLLGRIQSVYDGKIVLAGDLKENLAKADKFEVDLLKDIDDCIEKNGLDIPKENLLNLRDGYDSEEILELDLKSSEVTSVIWAIGYKFDFSLIHLPILDSDGYPIHKRGLTNYPGLYLLGLPWLHTVKSGLLLGVGEDAAFIASKIVAQEQKK
ncbi:MAG: NAD(P)-binding domain-containing protein [Nostoc sp.]|uniref:NAD(P)-binding domain-containing protein n=1 Tax=Nostoc sp. TaxID=1180 RepID=UPI002FF811D2